MDTPADSTVPDDSWLVRGDADPAGIADHYDRWAEAYDDDLVRWSYRAPEVAARAVLDASPHPDSLLDVGCGTGMVGAALRAGGYTGTLTGLDISEDSLARARHRYDDVRVADLTRPLDLPDDAFGALTCVGVMTYLPDVEATWREFTRVVQPGGRIVMTQREDLWEPRACQDAVDRLAEEGRWSPIDIHGPAAYLPEADGALADLGCYYLTLQVR